jgi:hypothetical protein
MRSASEKAAAVSALRNDGKQMEPRAGAKKDFETNSRVSSLLQVCPRSLLTAESGFKTFNSESDALRLENIISWEENAET